MDIISILSIIAGIITGIGFSIMVVAFLVSYSNKIGDSTGDRFVHKKEPAKVIRLEEYHDDL